jgi:hypothetical protein
MDDVVGCGRSPVYSHGTTVHMYHINSLACYERPWMMWWVVAGLQCTLESTRMVLPCLYHIENTVNGPTQSCVYIIRRSVCTVRYIPVYVPHQEGPVIGPAHARAHLFFWCIARGQVTGLRFGDTAE